MALFDKANNLLIYEAGRSVPLEAQKAFSNGSFSGTDINPMWRIKTLTEIFGPAGIGWYTEVLSERAETYGDTVMAIVDINLYVKVGDEWSKPIYGTGGNLLVQVTKSGARPSDEGYKKAYTDALSIACKALGIGADIWYSKDPTSKYSDKYVEVKATPVTPAPKQERPAPAKAVIKPTKAPVDTVCSVCKRPISDVVGKDGQVIPADEVARISMNKSGKTLCSECFASWRKVQRNAGVDV